MAGQPLDGGGVEQVGRIDDGGGQRAVGFDHGEFEIELGRHRAGVERFDGEAGHAGRLLRHVLQREHRLDDRLAAQVTDRMQRLDQLLERQVLMRIGVQRGGLDAVQHGAERGCAVEPAAQRQHVDEEADQALGLGAGASRNGGSDHHVVLAAPARQQHLEGGEQQHEQGGAVPARQLDEGGGAGGVDGEVMHGTAKARHRRARPVGRQLQGGRCSGELMGPVGELALERAVGEPAPLPHRIVGILHRQFRQRRGQALRESGVQRLDLTHQHADRPAVGDDVMHRQHQHVLVGGEPQQRDAQQPVIGEIEPLLHDGPRLFAGLLRRHRERLERYRPRPINHLDGRLFAARKAGAQRLVAAHHLTQRRRQCRDVQPAHQPHRQPNIVASPNKPQLLQKPQPLLRMRKRCLWRGAPFDVA